MAKSLYMVINYRKLQYALVGRKLEAKGEFHGRVARAMSKRVYESGTGNVFKDIGVPNAEEHLIKAQLVSKIDTIMKQRHLKQIEAASLFGVKQPDVSKMLRGEFRQFSVERLLRFLVALDQDVEITVKPHRGRNDAATLHVF
jgi:predicted XRE-type DNA-binding protein